MLKKWFPYSYKAKSLGGLITSILIYIVIGILAGLVIWLATAVTGWIPVIGGIIGWILGIVGSIVQVYNVAGIVIAVLVFLKILK